MSWVATAVVGGTIVGGIGSALIGSNAASNAASAQQASANAGIAAQQAQFAQIQKLLQPYVQGGTSAFGQQQDLIGVNGNAAQQSAVSALQGSPAYTSALQAGNNNILANASATGGLRGGNVQGALSQFAPNLLAASINDRFNQLGTLSSVGQNAAAGVGNAGSATANNVTSLLGQIGSSQAGNALAQGNAASGALGSVASGFGTYAALGGRFGGSTSPSFSYDYGNSYNPNASLTAGGLTGYKGSGSGL